MVNFIIEKGEINKYIKARFLFSVNSNLISMIIVVPFVIYFFCIGIFVDKEALLFAFSFLLILICLFFYSLFSYKIIKRFVIESFNKVAKQDVIEYNLSKNKDLYELVCLNNDKKLCFEASEIKKIKKYKNVIMLRINSKRIIALPNIKEIINLITIE